MDARKVRIVSAFLVGLGLSAGAIGAAASAPVASDSSAAALSVPRGWTLQGVVVLSRHGLRAPIEPVKDLDKLTVARWPDYGVPTGYLLPQGYKRAVTLGKFYRLYYTAAGLFPGGSRYCPTGADARFHFDPDGQGDPGGGVQRVRETAQALARGMFPGCDVRVSKVENTFGASCSAPHALRASRLFVGGSWAAVADGELKRPLALMSKALGPFQESSCGEPDGIETDKGTTLSDYDATKTDPGPINCADELSENFLMQYEAGFPIGEVAFGRLGTGKQLVAKLKTVNEIHALNFAAGNMPPYIARRGSSNLASAILDTVNDIANGDPGTPRFTVLVGHDNDLLNVGGMLGSTWTVPSYNENQTPPAGAMIFEVWRTNGGPVVRSLYVAQKIEQMRQNEKLTLASPPGAARMPVAGCDGPAGSCALKQFSSRLTKMILTECPDSSSDE